MEKVDPEKAYGGRSALVTGGASFIGSHLVDALANLGADVAVADDFSSGRRENIARLSSDRILELDLADRVATAIDFPDAEYVLHLAAVHGARGFIHTLPDQVLVSLAIDNNVYSAAAAKGARRIVHASSACVYPVTLQAEASSRHLLSESEAGFDSPGKAFPDGAYGWAKIMGEYQLAQFAAQRGLSGASARIFTAYGERENESHAVVALMSKALLRIDPYPVWGDGTQTRNFTYVSDTVPGPFNLGGLVDDIPFRAVNVGSSSHHTVLEFVETFELVGWRPEALDLQTWRPVGLASRASDNTLTSALFEWEPSVALRDGVIATLDWYEARADRPTTFAELEELLLSR